MKNISKIILVLIGLLFLNCSHNINDKPLDIYLNNTSNQNIRFLYDFFPFEQEKVPMHYTVFLLEGHKINFSNGAIRTFDFKKYNIFFIKIWKQSTLDRYTWEEIQQKDIYDKKYSLTLDDIQRMNYTIVYDGK